MDGIVKTESVLCGLLLSMDDAIVQVLCAWPVDGVSREQEKLPQPMQEGEAHKNDGRGSLMQGSEGTNNFKIVPPQWLLEPSSSLR